MGQITRRVVLEQSLLDRKSAAGIDGPYRRDGIGLRPGKALKALDCLGVGGKAARGQLRRHQPVHGRFASVQQLGHGTKHRLQARRLHRSQSQRMCVALGIQAEQARRRD